MIDKNSGKTKNAKYFLIIVLMAVFGISGYALAQDQTTETIFFSGYQDIPVMPGLAEIEGRSFTFDKPEGDITEIVASLQGVEKERAIHFYKMILPEFGWSYVNEARFFRKNEFLDISFEKEQGEHIMKIMIGPSL